MKVQNALANRMDTANEMSSYDEACKQILANKIILAWIMKHCVKEYADYSVDKKETLKTEFGIPMTRKLESEVEKLCNLSQGVYDKGYDKATVEHIKNMMRKKDGILKNVWIHWMFLKKRKRHIELRY